MIERFNESDWRTYAGATKFEDGSEPMIIHGEEYDVIFCPTEDYKDYTIQIIGETLGYVKVVHKYDIGSQIMIAIDDTEDFGYVLPEDVVDLYGFHKMYFLKEVM